MMLEDAYSKYWNRIESNGIPRFKLFPYDLCEKIKEGKWFAMTEWMVSGELCEAINQLNAWTTRLLDMEVWLDVVSQYEEDDAWIIRSHFVEPLVYFCMFQPSATRDRIGKIATNAIHQANLATTSDYRDSLDEDTLKRTYLTKSEREEQLQRICSKWQRGRPFVDLLQKLDSPSYRSKTFDYRNREAHFIAPRIELGEVLHVTRYRVPKDRMVEQTDGSFRLEVIPGEWRIAYGFGELRPLSLKEVIDANAEQYEVVVRVFEAYSRLLEDILAVMKEQHACSLFSC